MKKGKKKEKGYVVLQPQAKAKKRGKENSWALRLIPVIPAL